MTRPSVAIVGAGKAGTALGVGLARDGYEVTGVASRTPD
ncbi:MAG: NAD(P)-binding domain-containing protein, partial [Desulfotomaculales bacterium]